MKAATSVHKVRKFTACAAIAILSAAVLFAQTAQPTRTAVELASLYRDLAEAPLDPKQVFSIKDALVDQEDIHISLDDGTIAFTRSVGGEITGAFFQGDGEILLIPPEQAERASVSLFTGQAVLEERFATAYFRFNDDFARRLQPYLGPAQDSADFIQKWNPIAVSLAQVDALRLLRAVGNASPGNRQRFFHGRLGGVRLGNFDVTLDSALPEQISIAQTGYAEDGAEYYDVWAEFPMRSARESGAKPADPFDITNFKIKARILPNRDLAAEANIALTGEQPSEQVLIFELSRFLKVSEVSLNGAPLTFIQNEAIRGSELARRGNDLMAVLLPAPLTNGQHIDLKFTYAGSVISDAGGGLMYVGARGTWYPNRGPEMANFDLEFRSPAQWTVVATGKRVALSSENGDQVSHWISERQIPLAGFNVGQYVSVEAPAGPVQVATYAAHAVETTLAAKAAPPPSPIQLPREGKVFPPFIAPQPVTTVAVSPDVELKPVEARAVHTVDFYSRTLGPYPYSSLALTQMPGPSSQGWPGLIFLSSRSFLKFPAIGISGKLAEYDGALYQQLMPEHEIAHQWWGDSIIWESYRDQWLMEALANYCALLEIEERDPQTFRMIMQHYREDLLAPSYGRSYRDAGAVTLGVRLSSSKFPYGYERVAYERGSWLIHMLREILTEPGAKQLSAANFLKILGDIHRQYDGGSLSTRQFQQELEKRLPPDVRYEKKAALDWFFDGWINGTAVPRFTLKDLHIVHHAGKLEAAGTLAQEEAPKDLVTLVPLYAINGAASTPPKFAARVFADGLESSFRIVVPPGTKNLVLDPEFTILRQP